MRPSPGCRCVLGCWRGNPRGTRRQSVRGCGSGGTGDVADADYGAVDCKVAAAIGKERRPHAADVVADVAGQRTTRCRLNGYQLAAVAAARNQAAPER